MTILINIISLVLFLVNPPVKIMFHFNLNKIGIIIKRGLFLTVYHTSFYLIMISSLTVVSIAYTVEELGYYSFANRLSQASFMGLTSIAWVIFPKLLFKLRNNITNQTAKSFIKQYMPLYVTTYFLIVFLTIAIFPIFIHFFEKYENCSSTFVFLILSQGVLAYRFGYTELAIARNYEIKLAVFGFLAIAINVVIAIFFIKVLHLQFGYIAFATLLSVVFYIYMILRMGSDLLEENKKVLEIIKAVFSYKIYIPFVIVLFGNFTDSKNFFYAIGLILYLIMNYGELISVFKLGKIVFTKADFINC